MITEDKLKEAFNFLLNKTFVLTPGNIWIACPDIECTECPLSQDYEPACYKREFMNYLKENYEELVI